jgi:hypothetical protein
MRLRKTASAAALVLAGFAAAAEARTITVDCTAGQRIGPRLFFALPGDVSDSSWAGIVNNTIGGHLTGDGITINDNSSARIGFLNTQDAVPSPNFIDGNFRGGVTVNRSANARIAGNSFSGNGDYAVRVVRGGQADVAGNAMNNNRGGVLVRENSTVILADAGGNPGTFLTAPNTGVNTENGVRCREAGVVSGSIGPLTGGDGPVSAPASALCGNFIVP